MAYNSTYVAGDLSSITIDFVVKLGVFLVSFATLIGMVLLYIWLKKRM